MRVDLRYGQEGLQVLLPDANVEHVLRFHPLPATEAPAATEMLPVASRSPARFQVFGKGAGPIVLCS